MKKPRFEDLYELDKINILGKGQFSHVFYAKCINTGKIVAAKKIDKSLSDKKLLKREIKILKKCKHPNIIEMSKCFESINYMWIILEYVEHGDLFDFVEQKRVENEYVGLKIIQQLGSAISYLHGLNIMHRDLKPENILLHSKSRIPCIKVADFGLSRFVDVETTTTTGKRLSFCGSSYYSAPEMFCSTNYTNKIDMWSLGVIVYVVLTGYLPFGNIVISKLIKSIIKVNYSYPKTPILSTIAKFIIESLLVYDPKKRLSALELVAVTNNLKNYDE